MSEEKRPSPEGSTKISDDDETGSDFSDDQPEVKRQRRCTTPTKNEQHLDFEPGDYVYFSSSDSEKVIEAVERAERSLVQGECVSRSAASSDATSSRRSSPSSQSGYTRHLRVSILAVIPSPPNGSDSDSSSNFQEDGEEEGDITFPERWHQILDDSEWSKSSASDQSGEVNADDQVYEMEFEVASISESELNQNPIEDVESSSGLEEERVQIDYPAVDDHDGSSGVADNFADEESDISLKSNKDNYFSDSELEKDKWPCHQCKTLTYAVSRYCLRCFRTRRNWLPKRPKSRKARARDKLKRNFKNSRSDRTSSSESGTDQAKPAVSPAEIIDTSENLEVSFNEVQTPVPTSSTTPQTDSQSSVNVSSSFQDLTPSSSCTSSQTSQSSDGSQFQSSFLDRQKSFQTKIESTSSTYKNSPTKKNLKARENSLNMEAVSMQTNRTAKALDVSTCDFCFEGEKDAAFVHNKIAHQCCCFSCANKILRRTGKCPICRERILRVVRVINA
ncbi:unnamed protein product [Allacma fusca]|uniref:Uncharacterized protein n=1 Tax=Allacma fusca TaxID=39272 RepID=A0A8J2JX69_9HEXA|nr:unnamed protein product [Allacma fusca]